MLKKFLIIALTMTTLVVSANAQETFSRRKAGQPQWDYHQSSMDYDYYNMPGYGYGGYGYDVPPPMSPYMDYNSYPMYDNAPMNIHPHKPSFHERRKSDKKQIDKGSRRE